MYVLWTFEVATEDYMMYNALLVVFPSFVEMGLEVQNFFKKQKKMRHTSIMLSTFNGAQAQPEGEEKV